MERGRDYIDAVHDAKRLEELRALPLERKIQISQARIIEWYKYWGGQVVVSFSGGKDSTVLLHLVRSIFPDVKAVFSNTGLEYPEIQRHVMGIENVDIVRPAMRFDEVISTYGYPLIGKEVAEAIYYARRIRSQSLNVERERERGRRYSKTDNPEQQIERHKRNELTGSRSTSGQCFRERDYRTVTVGGGVLQDSESSRDTAAGWNARSSHRDKHCEEQTNNPDGRNGGGTAFNPIGNGTSSAERSVAERAVGQGNVKSGKWRNYHRRSLHPDESNPTDKDCFWNRSVELRDEPETQRHHENSQTSRGSAEWKDWRRGCL